MIKLFKKAIKKMTLYIDRLAAKNGTPFVTVTTDYTALQNDSVIYVNNTSPCTITLPAASLFSGRNIRVISISSNNSKITVDTDGGLINNASSVFMTTQLQQMNFYANDDDWYKSGTSIGWKSNQLFVATQQLDDGSASYAFATSYGDENYVAKMIDNVTHIFFTLEIVITGSPSTQLITTFNFADIIKSNFTSNDHCVGFSKLFDAVAFGGGFTNDFYTWFMPNPGTNVIWGRTAIVPVAGTYFVNIGLTFTNPS